MPHCSPILVWCVCLALPAALAAQTNCSEAIVTEDVASPEATDLVDKIKGHIITDDSGDITAVSLPDRKTHVVRHLAHTADGMGPTINALSGPDREGRIAYVEDYFFVNNEKERRHLLNTINIDGTNDTELFSRPGSAMWPETDTGTDGIGSYVALAPTSRRVAFIGKLASKQMPRALLTVGHMEIWNVAERTGNDTKIIAMDEPMSWFPDGQRIAYSALVARKELPQNAGGLAEFGDFFGTIWDEIPAIYIYEVKSQKSTFFHVGWQPVVSHDGQTVFVGGWGRKDYTWCRVNATTGESSPLKLPEGTELIGTAPGGFILCVAWPTADAPAVMVVDETGERFQTIVPLIDRPGHTSFGPAK